MNEGNKKSPKSGIIIAVVAVILVVALGVGAYMFLKPKDKQENAENTVSSQTEKAKETNVDVEAKDNIKVKNSGLAEGLFTVDDVDYVSDMQGIHKITSAGRTTLTSQKTISKFTIINDKVYYGVEEKRDSINSEGFDEDILWKRSSCWKMNLDGTQQENLFSYKGCGYVIYADDNCIIYADDGEPGIYTSGYGYWLYKYDLQTKTSILIDSGKDDDNVLSVDNFTYSNGGVYYNIYEFDADSPTDTFRYDISENKVYKLEFESNKSVAVDDDIILFVAKVENENHEYSFYLNKYNSKTNKSEKIKEFGKNSVYLNSINKQENGYYIYDCSDPNGTVCFVNTSTWEVTETSFTNATQLVYAYENNDDKSEILEYKNGSKNVLFSVNTDVRSLTVGKNVGVYLGYDYENTINVDNPNEFNKCVIFELNK